MARSQPATEWRNRIVGHGEEAPDQLLANPKNWRTHPVNQREALRGALDQVGWVQQVMVNRITGHIVDGHARVEEALSRGEPSVPVLYVELEPHEEDVVLATLDPIGALAQADNERLRMLLAEVEFDAQALRDMTDELLPIDPKAGLTDPDAVPDVADDTGIVRGDLFALGDHRLMCGDSTNAEDVARLMDGSHSYLCVTSPPYHVGIDYSEHIDRGALSDYLRFVGDVIRTWLPTIAPGGVVAWNVGVSRQTRHMDHFRILEEQGLTYWREIVWVKSGVALPQFQHTRNLPVARNYHPHYRHELVYLFVNGDEPIKGERIALPAHGESDVWDHVIQSQATRDLPAGSDANAARKRKHLSDHPSKAHPAAYPVALPSTIAGYMTGDGEVMSDPFMGSGTTMIAAEQLGRRAYGMEIDPRYVAVAIERWEKFTGRKAVKL